MKKPNPKMFMALTAMAVVIGGYISNLQYSSVNELKANIKKLKSEDKDEHMLTAELNTVDALLATSQSKLDHLEQSVSQTAYVPTLLKELENIGRENGIAVLGVRPIPKVNNPKEKKVRKPYVELDIEVKGRGSYAAVQRFVQALKIFPKVVAARTLALTPKVGPDAGIGVNLDVEFQLSTYLFPSSEATSAPAKPLEEPHNG